MQKESEKFLLKLLNGNTKAVDMINQWFLCRRDKNVDYITEKQHGILLYYARELSLFNYEAVNETFCVFYNNNKKNKEIFFK